MDKAKTVEKFFEKCLSSQPDPALAIEETRQAMSGLIDASELDSALNNLLERYQEEKREIFELDHLYGVRRPGTEPWYPGPHRFTLGFWKNLQRHLREDQGWSEERLHALERSSTEIVAELGNPSGSCFDVRGMVVGHIQSGKTASMTGVIAMAVDAGYEVVIVLSGLTNALRKQTQIRLEGELCRSSPKISERWRTWTTGDSDFKKQGADPNHDFGQLGNRRHLAVIKKNVSPLKQLIRLLEEIPRTHLENRRFLIIDDECDQAGVNAATGQQESFDPDNPEETNRTAINRLVTKLLSLPARVSYVGYTATPYANVLINPSDAHDIFPGDFIRLLDAPSVYYGMERLFGRDPSNAEDEGVTGLDAIRSISEDEVAMIRPKGKAASGWTPSELPESLADAFDHFLMTTAARRLRGQDEFDDHSTMLVHATHLVAPQMAIAEAIRTDLIKQRRSQIEGKDSKLRDRLARLWKREANRVPREPGVPRVDFDQIWDELPSFTEDVEVIEEHGLSEQRINFESRRHYSVIVGGNILSRGLTIEGLCVSYFVRPTKLYDSLSQMGRWFGYRLGFEDLVRVWMDDDLADAYRAIARVDFELRSDIQRIALLNASPKQLQVRIRCHPSLSITAKGKMQWAQPGKPAFEGRHWQTTVFVDGSREPDRSWLADTLESTAAWIDDVHAHHPFSHRDDGRWLATDVPIGEILRLLGSYGRTDERFPTDLLVQHLESIRRDDPGNPCMRWNVIIDGRKDGGRGNRVDFGHHVRIRPIERTRKLTNVSSARGHTAADSPEFDIKGLFGVRDLARDFPPTSVVTSSMTRAQLLARRGPGNDCDVRHPLLTIARIAKDSRPEAAPKDPENPTQAPLRCTHDLVGLGVVFPSTGFDSAYVQGGGSGEAGT